MVAPSQSRYDVLVIGTGIAGLSAALAAAAKGLSVAVFEKDSVLGGATCLANLMWIGANHLDTTHGDTVDQVADYLRFVADGQHAEENLLAFAHGAPRALKFFEECGVRFRLVNGMADHYYGFAPGAQPGGRYVEVDLISELEAGPFADSIRTPKDFPVELLGEEGIHRGLMPDHISEEMRDRRTKRMRGRGMAHVIHFLKQAIAHGVEIISPLAVSSLVVEDECVVGVRCANDQIIHATKGVVIATGGYESNPELVHRFEDLPRWLSVFPPCSTGDGLIMAGRIGASVTRINNNMHALFGLEMPGPDGELFGRLAGQAEILYPHSMVVNRHGNRFADETVFAKTVNGFRAYDPVRHEHINVPCYFIFDAQFAEKFSVGGLPSGSDVPQWVTRANSLKELAILLDIDPTGVENTVYRFNEFSKAGVDEDFGRPSGKLNFAPGQTSGEGSPNASLGSIAKPPFYGVEVRPAGFASAGITTNGTGQVIDYDGKPIAHLYAVGQAAAHLEYGVGYQAGTALSNGMTFGYLAALHMAEN